MARKDTGKKPAEAIPAQEEARYRRERIMQMPRYEQRLDALIALLRPEGRYTLQEVDDMIDGFMKKEATV